MRVMIADVVNLLHNVNMTVGNVLLRNICATISPHLVTAIMGPSGAGKLSQLYVCIA